MENIIFNGTINLSNFGNELIKDCSFSFKQAIQNTCNQWKGYSTNAHDLYFILVMSIFIIGILQSRFKLKFEIKIRNEVFEIFSMIKTTLTLILFFRIIQVWYIIKYVLV